MARSELLCPDFPALQLVRTGRLVRLFGRLTLYALVATIIIMLFVPWQQTAPGVGVVVALNPQQRPQPVFSPSEGMIVWTKEDLREGSYVEEGQLLLRLEPFASDAKEQIERQMSETRAAQTLAVAIVAQAEDNAARQKESADQNRVSFKADLNAASEKVKQAQNEADAIDAIYQDKKNQLEIAKKVIVEGIISGQELYTKQQAFEEVSNKLLKQNNAYEQALQELNRKQAEILAKQEDIQIKVQEALQKVGVEKQKLTKLNAYLIEQQQKLDKLDRLDVTAPRSGFIQQWSGREGSDAVKPSDQLFVIVPDASDLAFEMKVTGNDIPLIHEGDPVRIQFEGWPAVQFVGWPSVAIGTFGGKVDRVFPTDDGKGNFRVIVVPDKHFEGEAEWPDNRYLRQGVRANGWVLLREVPLGYEIWRQLNGFPPIVSDEEPQKGKSDKGSKVKLPKA